MLLFHSILCLKFFLIAYCNFNGRPWSVCAMGLFNMQNVENSGKHEKLVILSLIYGWKKLFEGVMARAGHPLLFGKKEAALPLICTQIKK